MGKGGPTNPRNRIPRNLSNKNCECCTVKRPFCKAVGIVPYRFVDEEFPSSSWHWKGYRDLFETLPERRAGCFGCGSAGQLAQLEGSLAAEKATMGNQEMHHMVRSFGGLFGDKETAS